MTSDLILQTLIIAITIIGIFVIVAGLWAIVAMHETELKYKGYEKK